MDKTTYTYKYDNETMTVTTDIPEDLMTDVEDLKTIKFPHGPLETLTSFPRISHKEQSKLHVAAECFIKLEKSDLTARYSSCIIKAGGKPILCFMQYWEPGDDEIIIIPAMQLRDETHLHHPVTILHGNGDIIEAKMTYSEG